jgi:hypothetical protein
MSGRKEKWQELCEQVIAESDSQRLTELVAMLNCELDKRYAKPKPAPSAQNGSGKGGQAPSDVA